MTRHADQGRRHRRPSIGTDWPDYGEQTARTKLTATLDSIPRCPQSNWLQWAPRIVESAGSRGMPRAHGA